MKNLLLPFLTFGLLVTLSACCTSTVGEIQLLNNTNEDILISLNSDEEFTLPSYSNEYKALPIGTVNIIARGKESGTLWTDRVDNRPCETNLSEFFK